MKFDELFKPKPGSIAAQMQKTIDELNQEIKRLKIEVKEQAVLNGKGSEREARLLAENAALKADKARLEKYIAEKLHQLEVENTGQEVQIEQLEAENAALKTALDHQMNYQRELRADKDRLDWLDKTGCWLTVPGSRKGQKFFAGTARAVIDSEMGIEQ